MSKDINVLVNAAEIVAQFGVSMGAVRAWIAAERIKPVRREGKGRGGEMRFARGDVGALVFGMCPACGNAFKRKTLKAKFCSKLCRQRMNRRLNGKA